MKTNDYIKFLTQEFVTYVDQPKNIRKRQRMDRHHRKKNFLNQLFGLVPMALMMFFRRKQ